MIHFLYSKDKVFNSIKYLNECRNCKCSGKEYRLYSSVSGFKDSMYCNQCLKEKYDSNPRIFLNETFARFCEGYVPLLLTADETAQYFANHWFGEKGNPRKYDFANWLNKKDKDPEIKNCYKYEDKMIKYANA